LEQETPVNVLHLPKFGFSVVKGRPIHLHVLKTSIFGK